mmetsp:Transcript_51602/g.121094  ORF Transcript_51602/g.121094 Transcript_51602/m.121094 type:complete len:85 (-) Transcript_51602:359-613(-)
MQPQQGKAKLPQVRSGFPDVHPLFLSLCTATTEIRRMQGSCSWNSHRMATIPWDRVTVVWPGQSHRVYMAAISKRQTILGRHLR